jgi:hypothetical protein
MNFIDFSFLPSVVQRIYVAYMSRFSIPWRAPRIDGSTRVLAMLGLFREAGEKGRDFAGRDVAAITGLFRKKLLRFPPAIRIL